jgi:hypothetical protein
MKEEQVKEEQVLGSDLPLPSSPGSACFAQHFGLK